MQLGVLFWAVLRCYACRLTQFLKVAVQQSHWWYQLLRGNPDGHIIGGAIGGRLIAANPVQFYILKYPLRISSLHATTLSNTQPMFLQVVACSFVYAGGTKLKSKAELESEDEKLSAYKNSETYIDLIHG